MEGTERLNVEARIKVLRNIQVLLDAAVMEMNQYSVVVGRLNLNPAPAPVAAATGNATAEAPVASAPTAASSAAAEENVARSFVTPEETGTKPKAATASTSGAAVEVEKSKEDEQLQQQQLLQTMDGEGSSAGPLSDEQMEIRRRRLEKFAKKDEGGVKED